jgi:uncharacterized protein
LPSLLDVNVLFALLYGPSSNSESVKKWLAGIQANDSIAIAHVAQVAALRLLNNPAVMGADVQTGSQSWGLMDRLLEDSRIVVIADPPNLDVHLRTFTMALKYSPKIWSDAYLAAIAMASGRRMITFDRGFRQYVGLEVEILD